MSGGNVIAMCKEHLYTPGKKGIEGIFLQPPLHFNCAKCNEAYLLTYFAKLPPAVRQERLEQLEAAAHHAVEADQRGQFDMQLDRRPKITIN